MIPKISYKKDNGKTYTICIGRKQFKTPITKITRINTLCGDVDNFLHDTCDKNFKGFIYPHLSDDEPSLGLLVDVFINENEIIGEGQFWFDDYM